MFKIHVAVLAKFSNECAQNFGPSPLLPWVAASLYNSGTFYAWVPCFDVLQ